LGKDYSIADPGLYAMTGWAPRWMALAYTIFIGGIAGFGLWFWLIARCTMTRVAPFALLLPVFALISSVLSLGDRMTPTLAIGALLAISGVAITQVRPIARPNST
jgi:O-acetylserine/cysteine efflux transporter